MKNQPVPIHLEPIREAISAALASEGDILTVIVYGSAARGALRSGGDYPSDVDIAVAAEAELALERRLSLAAALAIALDREVDLVDLRRAHGTILREILTTGHFIRNERPEFIAGSDGDPDT